MTTMVSVTIIAQAYGNTLCTMEHVNVSVIGHRARTGGGRDQRKEVSQEQAAHRANLDRTGFLLALAYGKAIHFPLTSGI